MGITYALILETDCEDTAQDGRKVYLVEVGKRLRGTDATYVRYVPRLLGVSDIVADNAGPSTGTVIIGCRERCPVHNVGADTWTHYDDFHRAAAAFPSLLAGARATVFMERYDEIGTAETELFFSGHVRGVEDVSPGSITLQLEQRTLERKEVPQTRLDRAPVLGDARQDESTKGEPIPVALGAWKGALAKDIVGTNDTESFWLRAMGALGLRLPMAATLPWYKYSAGGISYLAHVWAEGNDLAVESTNYASAYIEVGNGLLARLYGRRWLDSTNTEKQGSELAYYDADGEHVFLTTEYPWVQVPIIPSPVGSNTTVGRLMVDGDPLTYGVLPAGATVEFEIPSGGRYGRISMNNADSSGDDGGLAPVGLKAAAMAVFPTGGVVPSSGATLRVQFCWSDGTVFAASTVSVVPPNATTRVKVAQADVPFSNGVSPGTIGAGWAGSKFANWEFTAAIKAPSGAEPDGPLWSGAGTKGKPFRIRVTNLEVSAPLYIPAVVFLVGCRLGITPRAGRIQVPDGWRNRLTGRGSTWRDTVNQVGEEYGQETASPGRNGWGRGSRLRGRKVPAPRSPIRIARGSYVDDTGRYTGTAGQTLTDPIHWATLLIDHHGYGDRTHVVTGTTLGSVETARSLLKYWWSNVTPTYGWPMNVSIADVTDVESAVNALCADCMGLRARKQRSDIYGFDLWAPVAMWETSGLLSRVRYTPGAAGFRAGSDTQELLTARQIARSATGAALQFEMPDMRSIRNRFKIRYGAELQWVAWCRRDGSDDGTGASWGYGGVMPYAGGFAASQLCDWSAKQFGESELFELDLPHVSDPRVATMVGMYYLARLYRPEIAFRLTGLLGLCDVVPGHLLRLDSSLMWRHQAAWDGRPGTHYPDKGWPGLLNPGTTPTWDLWLQVDRSEHQVSGAGSVQVVTGWVLPYQLDRSMYSVGGTQGVMGGEELILATEGE